MLQTINANKTARLFMVIAIAAISVMIANYVSLRPEADDQYFLGALENIGLVDYLIQRYSSWSGRVSLEAVMVLTIGHPWFWKVAIPATLIFLSVSIARISGSKSILSMTFIGIMLLLLVPYGINIDAVWWVTGYYNYLLPTAFATYALSVMLQDCPSFVERFLSLLSVILFAYAEQTAVAFIILSLTLVISDKKKITPFSIAMIVLCMVNFVILMKAPGNLVRLHTETWRWMPEFSEYTLIQKMALGFEKVHQSFTVALNVPLIALAAVLVFRYIAGNKKSIAGWCAAILSCAFIILSLISSIKGHALSRDFFSPVFITADKWSSGSVFASYFFIMMVIASFVVLILSAKLSLKMQIISVSSFITGCITVFMVGFSPTVYASLLRVDYVFEVCCIVSFMCIMREEKAP